MYDRELAIEILRQIYQAAQTILERFQPVKTVSGSYRLAGRHGKT